MELEFFCKPGTDLEWFAYWKDYCVNFLKSLNMNMENIRMRDHEKEELSHYSNATTDIEYLFPFGWGELWGIADRTNFDLTQHINTSGQDLSYVDSENGEKYVPFVIEPSLGADRVALAFLVDAYNEDALLNFYTQNGFEFLFSSESQEAENLGYSHDTHLKTRLMYFDLRVLVNE